MATFSDWVHPITLYIAGREPLLEGDLKRLALQALKTLPRHYPGLKILQQEIHPDRVELVLDFNRLDEDVSRVVLSFKSEVRNLARRKALSKDYLWNWGYEESGLSGR